MRNRYKNVSGFTIVEILVIVIVLVILGSISVLGYNSWQQNITVSQLKNDLLSAVTAMENVKNFGTGYPSDVNSINNFKASQNVTLSGGSSDGKTYCVQAVSSKIPNLYYYISTDDNKEPQLGQCVPTVTISGPSGTQVWMAKNVNTGDMVTSPGLLTEAGIQKYCYNDDINKCNTYGGMYTWTEAMQGSTTEGAQGVCPDNFHIPTDGEWQILESNIGMPAEHLGSESWTRGMVDVNGDGTIEANELENVKFKIINGGSSRLGLQLGGYYAFDSNFEGEGFGGFWTSTKGPYVWDGIKYRFIEGTSSVTGIGRWSSDLGYGSFMYVRCIKNS